MPTSRKPRKKSSPDSVARRRHQRKLQQCRLYRWENNDNSEGYFDVFGPFKPDENIAVMEKATRKLQRWMLVVTSYFLTEDGDYYEEQLTSGPHQWHIESHIEEIRDLIEAAIKDTKESGNQAHYEDTCSALFPYSDQLAERLDSDEYVQATAGARAETAIQKQQSQG